MEKENLEVFVQCIQNKIAVATAMVIIKSKPISSTIEDHFRTIKTQCLKDWQKQPPKSPFYKKIIQHQKTGIINEINNLMPTDNCIKELNQMSQFSSELSLTKRDSDDSSDIENNSEFINAIVKLKFIVNSRRKVKYSSVIQPNSSFQKYWLKPESESLPGGLFRHITHSSDTDLILVKCLESISQYLERSVLINSVESYNNNSVLQHILSDLKPSAHDPHCSFFITGFLRKSLDSIWSSKSLNKTISWEYQIIMLNELCCTYEICKNIIQVLGDKLGRISEMMREEKTDKCLTLIEKTPVFLKLSLRILKKWQKTKLRSEKKQIVEMEHKKVAHLWNKDQTEINEEQLLMKSLKDKIEQLVINSCKSYPLISSRAYDIYKFLAKMAQSDN